ncbi:MAG TPA: threonine/serine exporter family protein [Kofleriaceae bacterium]|nr:threonine/serine exporter family protein [Kofleriaceae bacterium]
MQPLEPIRRRATDQLPIADRAALERERIRFVLALGRALHRYGTPANRLEEALSIVCRQLGLTAQVMATLTSLTIGFGDPSDLRTAIMRVEPSPVDLAKLAQLDAIADRVADRELDPVAGQRQIEAIETARPAWGLGPVTLTYALTAASVAVFFGGGGRDVGAAAAIGLVLGLLALVTRARTHANRAFELLGAFVAAFGAGAFASVVGGVHPSIVTVASLIAMLPGLGLTTAMTELATRHVVSGTARLMSALIVLLELALGVAIGEHLAAKAFTVAAAPVTSVPVWAEAAAFLAASLGMVIVCQAERRAIPWILVACATGFVGTRLGTGLLGPHLGVFVGAFALGCLANVYARALDKPQQVVLVPATILLVPGSMGFRGMSSLLDRDTLTGIETTFATFVVAMAIVAGLLIANAVVTPRRVL